MFIARMVAVCLIAGIGFNVLARRRVGELMVDGVLRHVYVDGQEGAKLKYVQIGQEKVDVRQLRKARIEAQKAKYGNYSARLYNALQARYDSDAVRVMIVFNHQIGDRVGKLTRAELHRAKAKALKTGKASVEQELGIALEGVSDVVANAKHGWLQVTLTKGQIERLKVIPGIRAIFLMDDKTFRIAPSMDDVYGSYSIGGLAINGLLPYGHGYEMGVVEPGEMETGMVMRWVLSNPEKWKRAWSAHA